MPVVPAEADIQRLKSLGPGQKHAGMTIMLGSHALTRREMFDCCVTASVIDRTMDHQYCMPVYVQHPG